jgi:hypothetical protein
MNSFSRAFILLMAALACAIDVQAKSMKTRFPGAPPTPGTMKVPAMKGGTKGLRGTTPSGSSITLKKKGSGNPSPDLTALVRSVAPKRTGGETKKKEKKVHSSTVRTIPKGLFGGTSRGSSGGTTGGFPGGSTGGSTEESCAAYVSVSFGADDWSSAENAMILFDWATYDSATESFTEDPIWFYDIGDFTDGREYNLEECLDENACYGFVFLGECLASSWLRAIKGITTTILNSSRHSCLLLRQTPMATDLLMVMD